MGRRNLTVAVARSARNFVCLPLVFAFPMDATAFEVWPSDAFTPRICTSQQQGDVLGQSFNGNISFTASEIALHKNRVSEAAKHARDCVRSALAYQEEFSKVPEHFGFSPYYGANNKQDLLEIISSISPALSQRETSRLSKRMIPVSCVGVTLKCLEKGFVEAGLGAIWTKIHRFRCANKTRGIAVQYALRQLGWKTVYWNNGVQPSRNLKRGVNGFTYGLLDLPVDSTNGYPDTSQPVPSHLRSIPFGFGTAQDGFHVFIASSNDDGEFVTIEGSVGNMPVLVSEVNSKYPSGAFYQNPVGNLGVMSEYGDGIIAVPPQ